MGLLVLFAVALVAAIGVGVENKISARKKKKSQIKNKPVAKDLHKEDKAHDKAAEAPKLDAHGHPIKADSTAAAHAAPAPKTGGDDHSHDHPPKTFGEKVAEAFNALNWYVILGGAVILLVISTIFFGRKLLFGSDESRSQPKHTMRPPTNQPPPRVLEGPFTDHVTVTDVWVYNTDSRHDFTWEVDKDISVLIDQTWYEDGPTKHFKAPYAHHFEFKSHDGLPVEVSYTVTPK